MESSLPVSFLPLGHAFSCHSPAGELRFESPLEVVLYPDPRLRAPNKKVNLFNDPALKRLVDEMFDCMYR